MVANPARIDRLPHLPATDVKKRGWRGVMRTLHEQGAIVVTNHNHPEAVILEAAQYAALMENVNQSESRTASELDALRRRFDERLASLGAPAAGARLRSVMRGPARLRGKVKAGSGY